MVVIVASKINVQNDPRARSANGEITEDRHDIFHPSLFLKAKQQSNLRARSTSGEDTENLLPLLSKGKVGQNESVDHLMNTCW